MVELLAVDGNFVLFQAYHAAPDDLMANDEPVGATYLFSRRLASLLKQHQPRRVAVCFDRPEPTYRHERNPLYKAHRDATPPEVITQRQQVFDLLGALRIPFLEAPGYEADDLLATLAHQAAEASVGTVIVTGDRDALGLVRDPHVRLQLIKHRSDELLMLDEAGVAQHVGVPPQLYLQYAALRGDPSDNLEGIKGVGAKRAAELMEKYGSLEAIFDDVDSQTPALRKNLAEGRARAIDNVDLMRLQVDAPVSLERDAPVWERIDVEAVVEIAARLRFRNVIASLAEAVADMPLAKGATIALNQLSQLEKSLPDATVEVPHSGSAASDALGSLADVARQTQCPISLAYDLSADGHEISLLAITAAQESQLAPDADPPVVCCVTPELLREPGVADALGRLLRDNSFHAHDTKGLLAALGDLAPAVGITSANLAVDTAIAGFLTATSDAVEDLFALAERCCDIRQQPTETTDQETLETSFGGTDRVAADLATQALAVAAVAPALERELATMALTELYENVERPLVGVLHRMEGAGLGVDRDELQRQVDQLAARAAKVEAEVMKLASRQFNLKSPKVLAEVLFDDLQLTPGAKTARGYSTNANVLESIRHEHPIVGLVLEYREIDKLRSTVELTLLPAIDNSDGRIHASFSQIVARTGRLSSESPNLHNVPIRSDAGRAIRRAFVPAAGAKLLVADYDQIELRIIAHLSGDANLVAAFRSGEDIHTSTAAQVFDTPSDQVTPEQRSTAKMVSYGLAYGMEAYGLGQRLGVPTDEAAGYLESYFAKFPDVKTYMDSVVASCRETGYTLTPLGRRRYIGAISAKNRQARQAAERQAMNAPVQGLAADIFKMALVEIDEQLQVSSADSQLVLQVHDEVILEVPPAELDDVTALSVRTMIEAGARAQLAVPLEVSVATGDTWADAKR